ncbi:MAG: GHKL domain-containing protein [Roseburia sp.]|nr:GHKL domain-containing protein [Roseburia sp.]
MFGRKEKRVNEYQNALMEQHYAEVENMYRTMRGWRHDWHNHIQALSAQLDSGEYEKARKYLDEINESILTIDTVLKTGNTMADAILNSKISLMKNMQIEVEAQAQVPASLSVPDVELCIIIGNLLDNAMEACSRLAPGNRFVHIYIHVKGALLYMCFTNSAGKKQHKIGSLFLSSKGKEHGFGLVRVDSLVAKNGGYLTRASEDGGYTTEVTLPL